MLTLLQKGGFFMYPILVVSLVALGLVFERTGFLFFRLRQDPETALQKILIFLEKMNFHRALEECAKMENHPLGRIFKAGLLKSEKKDKEIERALEEHILREIPLIKARINYMALFANISTLLGLLGTIQGLIIAFEGVGSADAALKQQILADGISKAMLTTAFGLIVAIPCLVAYYILNNRGSYLIDQLEEKAFRLFNAICSLKRDQETALVKSTAQVMAHTQGDGQIVTHGPVPGIGRQAAQSNLQNTAQQDMARQSTPGPVQHAVHGLAQEITDRE